MPYGVTEQILESYAKIIIDLSLNKQVRRGDPIRKLDVETWKAERASTGLSDSEIADRIGLAVPQVTYIRNIVERRLFRTNQYRKLYRLGGGKRYRPGQYVDPEQALEIEADSEALREALVFDPQQVSRYITDGWWRNETLIDLVEKHASEQPEALAINAGNTKLSWKDLAGQVNDISCALGKEGLRRGNCVSVAFLDNLAAITLTLGALKNANVVLVVPDPKGNNVVQELETIAQTSARLGYSTSGLSVTNLGPPKNDDVLNSSPNYISEILKSEFNQTDDRTRHAQGIETYGAVGGDLAVLLPVGADASSLSPHTHHTVLASGRALASLYANDKPDAISFDVPSDPSIFATVLSLWLQLGVPLVLSNEDRDPDARTLRALSTPGPSDINLQTSIIRLAFSERETEVLISAETLACLYREPGDSAAWQALSGVESEQIDSTSTYRLRGPGFAPGYIGNTLKVMDIYQPSGWIRTRLDMPLRGNG